MGTSFLTPHIYYQRDQENSDAGEIARINKEMELAERRQNQIKMMEHFDVYDLSDYSILPTPSKEMTVRNYLTELLGLSDRFLKNDVFVNGKEIQPKDWGVTTVTEDDGVAVTPYIGLLQNIIRPIEAKIEVELCKDIDKQKSIFDYDDSGNRILEDNDIETMLNFYGRLGIRYKDRASWTGGLSPYAVHFKFFADLLVEILPDSIITYDFRQIGKLLSDNDDYYRGKIRSLKEGWTFDVTDDSLFRAYSKIWYEVESKITDINTKKEILRNINSIFELQHNLYGNRRL